LLSPLSPLFLDVFIPNKTLPKRAYFASRKSLFGDAKEPILEPQRAYFGLRNRLFGFANSECSLGEGDEIDWKPATYAGLPTILFAFLCSDF